MKIYLQAQKILDKCLSGSATIFQVDKWTKYRNRTVHFSIGQVATLAVIIKLQSLDHSSGLVLGVRDDSICSVVFSNYCLRQTVGWMRQTLLSLNAEEKYSAAHHRV